jgi:signal transduction histidine kinase
LQAEAQVQQQDALLQREKLAAMGTLLASVAHELNNPLAVMLMQADLLRHDASHGSLGGYAMEITEAATRCERLVRQFLTLARQHVPERTTVELHALMADTLELLGSALRIDTIAVGLHLAADLPRLWADPPQLQQVLVNLVTNAQQALRSETPSRRQSRDRAARGRGSSVSGAPGAAASSCNTCSAWSSICKTRARCGVPTFPACRVTSRTSGWAKAARTRSSMLSAGGPSWLK